MAFKVYLTDDSVETIEVLTALYDTHPGFEVVGSSSNSMDTMAALRESENAVDILSLDIQLGLEDGIEVCAQLMAQFPKLYVVMSSVESHAENQLRAKEAGASYFLAKPFGFRELDELMGVYRQWQSKHDWPANDANTDVDNTVKTSSEAVDVELTSLLLTALDSLQ